MPSKCGDFASRRRVQTAGCCRANAIGRTARQRKTHASLILIWIAVCRLYQIWIMAPSRRNPVLKLLKRIAANRGTPVSCHHQPQRAIPTSSARTCSRVIFRKVQPSGPLRVGAENREGQTARPCLPSSVRVGRHTTPTAARPGGGDHCCDCLSGNRLNIRRLADDGFQMPTFQPCAFPPVLQTWWLVLARESR